MSLSVIADYGPNGTGNSATVETPPTVQSQNSFGNCNEQWLMELYTPASLSQVPDGTLVTAQLEDTTSGATLNLAPYTGSNSDTEDVSYPADPTFAAGVATTEGTVLSDWFVVLQGRSS